MVSHQFLLRLLSVLLTLVLVVTTLGGSWSGRSAAAHVVQPERPLRSSAGVFWHVRVRTDQNQNRFPPGESVVVIADVQHPSDYELDHYDYKIVLKVQVAGKSAEWVDCVHPPVKGIGGYQPRENRFPPTCTAEIRFPGPLQHAEETVTVTAVVEDPCSFPRGAKLAQSLPVALTWSEAPVTPNMTWAELAAYRTKAKLWDNLSWIAGGAKWVTAGLAAKYKNVPGFVGSFGFAAVEWFAKTLKDEDQKLGADPVDRNYTVIATPVVRAPPRVPPVSGVSNAVAAPLNALLKNAEQMKEVTAALLTSVNRAQGAIQARNAFWGRQQMLAAAQYAAQDAAIVSAAPALLAAVQHTVQAARVQITVTAGDLRAFQRYVAAHGLPPSMTRSLQELGVDGATIDQMGSDFAVADPQAVPGTFPASLTDPQLIAAINAAAGALRQFAASASQGPKVPAALAATVPARGALFAAATHLNAAPSGSADAVRVPAAPMPDACLAPPTPTVQPTPTASAAQATPSPPPSPDKITIEANGAIRGVSIATGALTCTGAGFAEGTSCYVYAAPNATVPVKATIDAPLPTGWSWQIVWEPYGGRKSFPCSRTAMVCTATITVPALGGTISNQIATPNGGAGAAMYVVACKPGETPYPGHPCPSS